MRRWHTDALAAPCVTPEEVPLNAAIVQERRKYPTMLARLAVHFGAP